MGHSHPSASLRLSGQPCVSFVLDTGKYLVASDNSTGLQSAFKRMNLPSARARHGLSDYTPVVKLPPSRHLPKAVPSWCLPNSHTLSLAEAYSVGRLLLCSSFQSSQASATRWDAETHAWLKQVDPMACLFFSRPGIESLFAHFRRAHEGNVPPASMYTNMDRLRL